MIQTLFYVLGPFLLMAGIGLAALWLAVGKVRSMRCASRESATRQYEKWVEQSRAVQGVVLYALYSQPSLEGMIDNDLISRLEWLRDNDPQVKELT